MAQDKAIRKIRNYLVEIIPDNCGGHCSLICDDCARKIAANRDRFLELRTEGLLQLVKSLGYVQLGEVLKEQEREKAIAWQGLCESGQVAHVDPDD